MTISPIYTYIFIRLQEEWNFKLKINRIEVKNVVLLLIILMYYQEKKHSSVLFTFLESFIKTTDIIITINRNIIALLDKKRPK